MLTWAVFLENICKVPIQSLLCSTLFDVPWTFIVVVVLVAVSVAARIGDKHSEEGKWDGGGGNSLMAQMPLRPLGVHMCRTNNTVLSPPLLQLLLQHVLQCRPRRREQNRGERVRIVVFSLRAVGGGVVVSI